MGIPNLTGAVISVITRTAQYLFNRKSRQRREGEAASHLVSVLDKFVVDCDAVARDNGYDPFADPAHHDYRKRKPRSEEARLNVPDIPGRELLPLSISDRVRTIQSLQNDTSDALLEAYEEDDGSGDNLKDIFRHGASCRGALTGTACSLPFTASLPGTPEKGNTH